MGTAILSLDAELMWGFHDLPRPPVDRTTRARQSWLRLLDLLDTYDVPATWAIVGHLFLDECDGIHADHPAPSGWFDRDPGTRLEQDPGWYGRDLVNAIREATADHEIGSHGFSHLQIGHSEIPHDLAIAELEASRQAAGRMGVDLESFVFPRNVIGNRAALAEAGFACYRTRYPRRLDATPLRMPRKAIELAAGWPAPRVTPEVDDYGLVAIPPSIDVFGLEGRIRRAVRPFRSNSILTRIEQGLDRATDDGGIVHLWMHPNDLARKQGLDRVRGVLDVLEAAREDGLRVRTMGEVARQVREDEPDRIAHSM